MEKEGPDVKRGTELDGRRGREQDEGIYGEKDTRIVKPHHCWSFHAEHRYWID